MTVAQGAASSCSVAPTGRRFYIHQGSFIALVAAHPSWRDEMFDALAISAASRAAELVVEDALLFGADPGDALVEASSRLHGRAATDLAGVFQSLVHFDPPDSIETLLAGNEQVTAWCYEGGYFTYATDETSAQIMYLETGGLRELRSQIRRDPAADPYLKMISGPSLFLVDQRLGVGRGKAAAQYRAQHRRLLRSRPPVPTTSEDVIGRLRNVLDREFTALDSADATRLRDQSLRHASMTLRALGVGPLSRPADEHSGGRVPVGAST